MTDRKSALSILIVTLAILCFSSFQEKCAAEAGIHHVVGDDRGWDVSSNIASWANRRVFRVGDFVWFAYSAAEESIVELGSKDEYESCDVKNPIRMYTDGLSKVSLEGEGTRYFTSGNTESCKKGLKVPVEIKPKSWVDPNPPKKPTHSSSSSRIIMKPDAYYSTEQDALAAAPSTPSDATKVTSFGIPLIFLVMLFVGNYFC